MQISYSKDELLAMIGDTIDFLQDCQKAVQEFEGDVVDPIASGPEPIAGKGLCYDKVDRELLRDFFRALELLSRAIELLRRFGHRPSPSA